jgi:hypothetical protein
VIYRSRKRPRVRSISLRTFGWLCARQAAYQLFPPQATARQTELLRLALLRLPLDALRRMARPFLAQNPNREN